MENYIGKICPFCKTEITETDAVTVCPACGIAHHQGCWNENHGCTTFGCSEQHYEQQNTNPTTVCTNCGAPLGEAQAFCPNCGTPKAVAPRKTFCTNCGNELNAGQGFCPNCGQRAGQTFEPAVNPAINQFNAGVMAQQQKKKAPIKIILAAIAAILVIAIGISVLPGLMVSVEDLCAEGKYAEAYEKAEGSEKDKVLAEHVAAYLSQVSSDNMKDPDSFVLKDAYHYAFVHDDGTMGSYVILYIAGSNSYGNTVTNYWAYTLKKDGTWNDLGSVSVTYDESSDDWEEMLAKIVIRAGIEKGTKLSKDQVRNINNLFEEDLLYKVKDVDWDVIETSRFHHD